MEGSQGSPGQTPNPLGFAGEAFRRPENEVKTETTRELEQRVPPPPPAPPIEWDPAKTKTVLTALGHVLHSLDPVASTEYAPELWKLTRDDLEAMGEPLARIANRYDVARQVAGYSDEISIGVAAFPYVKRNLAVRGRAKALTKQADAQSPHASAYAPAEATRPAPAADEPEEPAPARPGPGEAPEVIIAQPITETDDGPEVVDPGHVTGDDAFGGLGDELRRPPHETDRG